MTHHITSHHITSHADYVIGSIFCQPLKQAFSHFCEKVCFVVSHSKNAGEVLHA